MSDKESEVVFFIELVEHLKDEFFAQLVLLVVLEVSVEDKANAAAADNMGTQVAIDPLNIVLDASFPVVMLNALATVPKLL